MKKLFLIVGFLVMFSAAAHGKTLRCSNSQMRWTVVDVTLIDPTHISFVVLDTVPNAKSEVGIEAHLSYRETVRPQGRVFLHFKGDFVSPKYQKTLALYLSQDLKTLTRLEEGIPRSWACQ